MKSQEMNVLQKEPKKVQGPVVIGLWTLPKSGWDEILEDPEELSENVLDMALWRICAKGSFSVQLRNRKYIHGYRPFRLIPISSETYSRCIGYFKKSPEDKRKVGGTKRSYQRDPVEEKGRNGVPKYSGGGNDQKGIRKVPRHTRGGRLKLKF